MLEGYPLCKPWQAMRGAWAPLTRERRSSAASDARGKAHAPGKAHTPAPQIVSQLPQASDLAPSSSAAAPCRYDSEKRWMTLGATAPEDGFYGGGGPGGGEGGFVDGGVDGGGDGDEDPCNSEDDDQHHSQFFSKRGWAHSSLRRSRKSAPSALEMPSLLRRGARAKLGRGMLQGGPRLQTILSTRWARTLSGENRTSTESSYWQERGVDELDDQAHGAPVLHEHLVEAFSLKRGLLAFGSGWTQDMQVSCRYAPRLVHRKRGVPAAKICGIGRS